MASFMAFVGALMILGTAPSWANQVAKPAVAETGRVVSPTRTLARSSAPSAAPSVDDDSYAAREAKAKSLETFKGGDVVVIGSTALIIILLVVLILVL